MNVGLKIKDLRKAAKLTQVELAKKANISRSYLGDLESNRYNASLDTLKAIANALDVPVTVLLDESNENPKDKIEKLVKENKIHTIAAHFEGEDFTDDDVEDIESFISYIVEKRKRINN